MVWIQGRLDDLLATEAATQLMALDGSGDGAVQLFINSGEGTLSAALTVMDTIAALGVPVVAVCSGRAEGPGLGVLAVAHDRQAAGHARLRLQDEGMTAAGTGAALTAALEHHQRQAQRFIEQVAAAARQPAERVEVDLAAGRYFELEEALQYRLIDRIWSGARSEGSKQ